MNHIYRVVFNHIKGVWQAVSEVGKAKKKTKTQRRAARISALAASSLLVFHQNLLASSTSLPTDGQVVAGSAQIQTQSKQVVINQTSNKAAIDWQTFNIAPGHTVTFNQPGADAVALNRVMGADPSIIQGALNANGQVFLVNPNGITFTSSAQVNVGGIVASTLDIRVDDFMAGNYQFSGNSAQAIINQGNINTHQNGYVAMIAAKIVNTGEIKAPAGQVLMAAGSNVTLDFGGPVKIRVNEGALDALIEQGGAIKADGGYVYLTASATNELMTRVINQTGIIEAQTLATGESGEIYLMGDMQNGRIDVAGTLDASAPNGGDGGFIETSAANVQIAPDLVVTTQAPQGQTGEWLIDPTDIYIVDGSDQGGLTGDPATNSNADNPTSSNIHNETINTALTSSNVTITTASSGDGNGDIFVNAPLAWSTNNTLILNADRNIEINASITSEGATGKLVLQYGQGAANGVIGGQEAFYRINAPVSLPGGLNFTTKLGSSGSEIVYQVITALGAEGSKNGVSLQGMQGNLNRNYALGASIDASATKDWNDGDGWQPIGSSAGSRFTGNFEGLGHTISNLTVNRPTTDDVGFFGRVDGSSFRNFTLSEINITGGDYVGGLVGFLSGVDGQIYNVNITGNVEASFNFIGGLVGRIDSNAVGASIENVISTVEVTGKDNVGGLVGDMFRGNLVNAYAIGSVTGSNNVGGLIGVARNDSSIENVYATGKVTRTGSGAVGGILGNKFQSNPSFSITNAFFDQDTTAQSSGVGDGNQTGVTGIRSLTNTVDAYTQATYTGFDFDNVWFMIDGETRPFLRMEHSTTITNANQLQLMAMDLDANYTLANDIDLAPALTNPSLHWRGTLDDDAFQGSFVPVGNSTNAFTGSFDGQGSTISNLTINRPTLSDVGLFGVAENVNISNLGLIGVDISGTSFVGGLVGRSLNNSEFTNLSVSGNINGSQLGQSVGGFVGRAMDSSFTNTFSTGKVVGDTSFIGGFVGSAIDSTFNNTFSTGKIVVATGSFIGGFVGTAIDSTFNNTFSTGKVVVDTGSFNGGFAGNNPRNSSTFTNTFWDQDTTGRSSGVGTGSGAGVTAIRSLTGTVDAYTQDTYTGFDFDKVWFMIDGETRPFLRMEHSTTITNANQLQLMAMDLDANYTLANDIDLAPALTNPSLHWRGMGDLESFQGSFVPVGDIDNPFTGRLDGLDHSISNLTIHRPTLSDVGLFGVAENVNISNLGLIGVDISGAFFVGSIAGTAKGTSDFSNITVLGEISGSSYIGGLIGYIDGAVNITGIEVSGSVVGTSDFVGGLVGAIDSSAVGASIENVISTVEVTGKDNVGGLVGDMFKGNLVNAYAIGSVTGSNNVGGLIGVARNDSSIENVYATGKVTRTGSGAVGGILGNEFQSNQSFSITNAFFDQDTTGQSSGVGDGSQTGVTAIRSLTGTVDAYTQDTYTGFDFDNVWFMIDGETRPFLRMEHSTTITNANQLQLMSMDLDANYTLANDIDLAPALTNPSLHWRGMGDLESFQGSFVPVGNSTNSFTGSFDGQGFALRNLWVDTEGEITNGIFGANIMAGLSNMHLDNASLTLPPNSSSSPSIYFNDLLLTGLLVTENGNILFRDSLVVSEATAGIQSNSRNIDFEGTVTLEGDFIVDAETSENLGNITFFNTIDGPHKLTLLSAGEVTLEGLVNIGQLDALGRIIEVNESIETSIADTELAAIDDLIISEIEITSAGRVILSSKRINLAADITTVGGNINFQPFDVSGLDLADLETSASFGTLRLSGNVKLDTGNAEGTIQFFNTKIEGNNTSNTPLYDLELSAGTGEIIFGDSIGKGDRFGSLIVISSADVTFNDSLKATSYRQLDASGITTFDSNVDLSEDFIFNGNELTFFESVLVLGEMQITNAGLFKTLGVESLDVGSFIQNGTGLSSLNDNVISRNGNIEFATRVDVSAFSILFEANGDIVFSDTLSNLVNRGRGIPKVEINAGLGLEGGKVSLNEVNAFGSIEITTRLGDIILSGDISTDSTESNAVFIAAGIGAERGGDGTPEAGNVIVDQFLSLEDLPSITVGDGGFIKIYTGSVGSLGLGQLAGIGSGNFRYNTGLDTNGNEISDYSRPLAADEVNVLYREQPTIIVSTFEQTMIYGDSLPPLSFATIGSINGVVNGDDISSGLNVRTASLQEGSVGSTNGRLNAGSHSIVVASSGTDAIAEELGYNVTNQDGTLTVAARPITVRADAISRVYGDENPALTFAVLADGEGSSRGIVNGETLTGELATMATVLSHVGAYRITQGGVTTAANPNYQISFEESDLTVAARPITVRADNQSRLFGQANPPLTFSVDEDGVGTSRGLVSNDNLLLNLSTLAGLNSPAGNYAIGLASAGNPNYSLTFIDGILTVIGPAVVDAVTLNTTNLDMADTTTSAMAQSAAQSAGRSVEASLIVAPIPGRELSMPEYDVILDSGVDTANQEPIDDDEI
ncbi:two-partner secretion domain-containing protein [Thiomicrospira cyclica]|uniref:Filamentous hemagglutinin family outer membrane protein n=1 Tax=Thiomicrospira cyclica (strain DSM 14477 / JCM 11371 / ALM1) TaxID=717773 RepID=F6D8L6_THICA|nr:MBG domain-containing protein [Thiomicrospira cyclica]AEG31867.1 filamentous hemagglutinin family outer membrane protein [Thiomicrospira cyclica ALM1]